MKTTFLLPLILAAGTVAGLSDDDLTIMSDEFDDSSTVGDWLRLDAAEGWNADKLEILDVDTSASGQMRLMPYTTSWYMDLTGPLVFKEVTGDFVVTLHLDVQRRNGQPGRPVGTFSLGGIMIRTPRAIGNANPQPDTAPGVQLPWPPAGYATDWTPDGENYIFLSYGNTDGSAAADQWNYEVKTTIDGDSTLYYDDQGVPAGTGIVTLQAVRIGSTFVVMRKHPGGGWLIENRYSRPDMPATLQVGITTYTDWGNIVANGLFTNPDENAGPFHHNHNVMTVANGFTANPDLVVDAEYFRYARPPAGLTEGQLQALPLTSDGAGVQFLSDTPLAAVLGDAANHPPAGPPPLPPVPLPSFQIDALIGKNAGKMIGDGIYNASGAGQGIRLKGSARKTLRFQVRLENDGTVVDTLDVSGPRKNREFRMKVIENGPGGAAANVTGSLKAGTYAPELAAGERVGLAFSVNRSRPRSGGAKRWSFVIGTSSRNLPDRIDVVRAKLQSR